MQISKADALLSINNMIRALDGLTVKGRDNCLIVVAVSSDLEKLKAYIEGGENGGQH